MMNNYKKMYRERIYNNYLGEQALFNKQDLEAKYNSRRPYLKKLIATYFPKNLNCNILDLGCGSGEIMYCASELGYKSILGIECSDQQIVAAKMLGVTNIIKGDLQEELSKLKEFSVDCIISFDVLEHFSKTEIIGFVDHVHRVLVKGGVWIIHVPNGESIFVGKILYGDFTHEIAFTKASSIQLLKASGFSNICAYEDRPVIHGLKSALRYLGWIILRFFLKSFVMIETGSTGEQIFSQNILIVAHK